VTAFPISEETPREHVGNALMILGCILDAGKPTDQVEIVDREDLVAIERRLHKALDQLTPNWRGRAAGGAR
jgi:hypothetical protein